MKIVKIMKRGEPKELAPLIDYNYTLRFTSHSNVPMKAEFRFAETEEDEDYGYDKIKGDVYALRFESLEDVLLMRIALDKVADAWQKAEGDHGE